MSRRVMLFRDTIVGQLVATTPVHVGGLGRGETDASVPTARDGAGRPLIPGTTLAGALRATLGDHDGAAWGGNPEAQGGASRVVVLDAPVIEQDAPLQDRWHSSIDRRYGSAATGHLFTRELLPTGTRFRFALSVETFTESGHDEAHTLVTSVVELLADAGLQVGASSTTGLGLVRLDRATITSRCDSFATARGLLNAATGTSPQVPNLDLGPTGAAATERLRLEITWRPVGPIMSKVARTGGVCDAFPATVHDVEAEGYRLLLPGSSIKGALRSRAELIARTATGTRTIPEGFVEQMDDAARLPGVGVLFGWAGNHKAGDPGFRGALRPHDVLTEVVLPPDEWRKVFYEDLTVDHTDDAHDQRRREELLFTTAVDALNEAVARRVANDGKVVWFDYAVRNAIDRWSGGVAEGRLFSSLEPYVGLGDSGDGAWRTIDIEIDLSRLVSAQVTPTARDAALALLLLTLADVESGWVPFGHGTSRGLGAVTVTSIRLTTPENPPEGSLPQSLIGADGVELRDEWDVLVAGLHDGWHDELHRFARDQEVAR